MPYPKNEEEYPLWLKGKGPVTTAESDAACDAAESLRLAARAMQDAAGAPWTIAVLESELARIRVETGPPAHRPEGKRKTLDVDFLLTVMMLFRSNPGISAASIARDIWANRRADFASNANALELQVQRCLRRVKIDGSWSGLFQEALRQRHYELLGSLTGGAETVETLKRAFAGEALTEGDIRILQEVNLNAAALRPEAGERK